MTDIKQLRLDYTAVKAWMLDCGEWSPEQADEIGQAIKAALDGQEAGYLAWWAEWLSTWALVARLCVSAREAMYQNALAQLRVAR